MYKKENGKKKKGKKKSGKNSKWIKPFWIVYAVSVVSIVLVFWAISKGFLGFMPTFTDLENPNTNLATEVYSYDGELLGKYYIENRSMVAYHDMPKNLTDALLATEDVRFYEHSGVDVRALFRVAFGVATGNRKGGGSTISQQLAKALFPRDDDMSKIEMVVTKLKEWVVASKLEREYSKNEIMAMYLNIVDFGNNSSGIKSASNTYFAKEPSELAAEESALLVGMLKAPTKYSPRRNPAASLERRNTVIGQMEKYNFLDKTVADSIEMIPIDMSRFKVQSHTEGIATYFREYIRQYLVQWCKENPKADGSRYDIYKDGLKIYTTIDARMQRHAEAAVREHVCLHLQPMFFDHWKGRANAPFFRITQEETDRILNSAMRRTDRYQAMKSEGATEEEIKKAFNTKEKMKVLTWDKGMIDTMISPMDHIRYMKSFLHCGMMAMEPNTGYVKAYVGGTDYNHFQFDHVKLSKRQVGSTFKPYVYTVAMQNGEYNPCKLVPNVPVTFYLPEGTTWTPKNSGDYKTGQMLPLKEALAHSLNYVSAYLMKQFGPQSVIELVRKMGMTSDIPAVPSICLGACELTLYEQVGAINCFPNQGVYVEPSFITTICDKEGNVIHTYIPETHEAIDQITTFKTVRLMQGVVENGTGIRLRTQYKLNFPLAGKTGTTDNQSDGWFVGYSPSLTCGVWVGCEDRAAHFRSISLGQGARTAMPVFALFMQKVYNDPNLPYKGLVETQGEGYDFQVPAAFTGDRNGCNEKVKEKTTPNFD
ncbi:transglycosylase domain-containing protein [Bacteroidales bacterium OttesenSCG-928-B11]|nr:transglycosylase domain-containing protein [Bacteroidales bacterium OttesenSCG-928-B11]MDL2326321.1 transglycosylase domain-containing protein [Bacteroidales bacterium OttesenSCG-928-A14]